MILHNSHFSAHLKQPPRLPHYGAANFPVMFQIKNVFTLLPFFGKLMDSTVWCHFFTKQENKAPSVFPNFKYVP